MHIRRYCEFNKNTNPMAIGSLTVAWKVILFSRDIFKTRAG